MITVLNARNAEEEVEKEREEEEEEEAAEEAEEAKVWIESFRRYNTKTYDYKFKFNI